MTLRLPDDLDAKLTERARRESRSKQGLAVEAIREAQDRAELNVDDVLAELLDSDAEMPDHLKRPACATAGSTDPGRPQRGQR